MKNDKNNAKFEGSGNNTAPFHADMRESALTGCQEAKRNAIVTGASRGIGRAVAIALAEGGWKHITICADRDAEGLSETERIILNSSSACRVISLLGDISDEAFVQELVDRACSEAGAPVDVLINNAGISIVGLVQDLSYADWHRIVDVNLSSVFLSSVFLTSRAVIPGMVREQAGHIINVSSMWGRVGASCEAAYSATKGGVIAFTRALAKELAPSGISVNAVAPGCVDTVMNGHLSPDEKAALAEEIPAGRFASPSEIASVIVGIAQAPAYMTGQVIGIDGGYI